jgi:hypothetical protein
MLEFYSMVMDHLCSFLLGATSYFFVNAALVTIHLLLISQGILVKLYHPADCSYPIAHSQNWSTEFQVVS